MSTLDMPQHIYVCRECHHPTRKFDCDEHPEAGMRIEPTLLYADFERYMEARAIERGSVDLPPLDVVWDRLESHADVASSNREAIENAIRAVVSER